MKKALLALTLTAALAASLVTTASGASARPRARPFAPRAAVAPASHTEAALPAGFCLPNIDGDNRILCVLGARPAGECSEQVRVAFLLTFWRCGRPPKPPTPFGCANLDGDQNFLCLAAARPSGPCTENFSILFVHSYHCTGGGRGAARIGAAVKR